MSNPNIKYRVELTPGQREELIEISKNGKKTAKQVNHANVLLMADDGAIAGRWRDVDISQALNIYINTVAAIRKKFAIEGIKLTLQRKKRETPPSPSKLDGKQAAHLIAINSEFNTKLADTAYSATPDSVAYGKYDLLTTISSTKYFSAPPR